MTVAKPKSPAASPPAFEEVFSRHVGFVARTLRHLGVPAADVEDVSQEVFVVVHRQLPRFEGRAKLSTWIYRIAWKTASNHRRARRGPTRDVDPLEREPSVGAVQEEQLASKRAAQRLHALLDELDAARRDVFVLYEIEQLAMREVCEIVGCPLQTGYSRLKSARAALLKGFEARGWKDESHD